MHFDSREALLLLLLLSLLGCFLLVVSFLFCCRRVFLQLKKTSSVRFLRRSKPSRLKKNPKMILHHLASALFTVLFGPFLLDVHSSSKEEVKVSSLDADQDLVAVFSVLRHGDRAPTDFYPLDPFSNASYWAPNGIGELNPLGIERMRESGRLYRERYRAFLDRVGGWPAYVRSSTRNRTIESAKYFLESFLADEGSSASASRVRANLSSMITLDQRMLTTSYPCNRSNAAWLQWFQSAEVTGYMKSRHGDIEHLGRLTGEDYFAAAPFTLRQLEFLATTTSIERDEYGLDGK